jgi:hypothetical protein
MKKLVTYKDVITLEHLSLTVLQVNQDTSGKQTVNRTYWSIRKKTSQPDESDGTSISKVSPETGRNIRHDKPKKQGSNRKFTQLSLFPKSKQ